MDALLETIGLTSGELSQTLILGVILLVGLFLLRGVFKLTATIFRLGCLGILFIIGAVLLINLLN